MRQKIIILLITFIILLQSRIVAASTVVTDPGAYSYLTGIDKKEQEQLEFLKSLETYNISIDNSLTGNKQIGYGINNNFLLYDDYIALTLSPSKSDKPAVISKNLEIVYPAIKVKPSAELERRKYQQASLRASLIFSEMIISSSRQKISQITSLASDIDGTSKLKEAIDVNSRLLLEILLEARNTNFLLANLTKSIAAKEYSGGFVIGSEERDKAEDFFDGEGNLGSGISNPSGRSGKFTKLTR